MIVNEVEIFFMPECQESVARPKKLAKDLKDSFCPRHLTVHDAPIYYSIYG